MDGRPLTKKTDLYNNLIKQKEAGRQLSIEDLTPEVLKQLFGEEEKLVAELFSTTKGKVKYVKEKYEITIHSTVIEVSQDYFMKALGYAVKGKYRETAAR